MKASEDPRIVYADIIDHPHHQSQTRAHMSLYDRAAQFSAFDALAGYSEMIVEEARLTENEAVLDENAIDKIFKVSDLCKAVQANANQNTFFGNRNGGSTIQLPFGFVQWHSPQKTIPGCLQFHHKHKCLSAIMPTGTHL